MPLSEQQRNHFRTAFERSSHSAAAPFTAATANETAYTPPRSAIWMSGRNACCV